MKLGRVAGTVVSTISHPLYDDRRLLMCDLLDADGDDTGDYLICVDTVGAGAGETVLILDEGNGARQVVAATTPRSERSSWGSSTSYWSTVSPVR